MTHYTMTPETFENCAIWVMNVFVMSLVLTIGAIMLGIAVMMPTYLIYSVITYVLTLFSV